MPIYYAVVEGDPLDNGGSSYVVTGKDNCTITDDNGRSRRVTYIGHEAWCDKCKSAGRIVSGVFPVSVRRPYSSELGQDMALGGDHVLCKCMPHPRIVSVYGRRSRLIDEGRPDLTGVARSEENGSACTGHHDEQFVLKDTHGQPLPETYYSIRLPSGEFQHGVTDSQGRTARYRTDHARNISIHLGHLQGAQ
ncbi:hypothetical protein [Paraburkholderia sp. D1E]|uniref:hypothetical protein n=1 Tax=Paraburkholderia sp. D1E TaxID=3461398 RepID=UPI00404640EB